MGGILFPTSLTPLDVRFRLLQICAALAVARPTILRTVVFDSDAQWAAAGSPSSGVVLSDCKLTPDDLPALAGITVGSSQESMTGTGTYRVTRNFLLLALFRQLCDDSMEEQAAALTVLWQKLNELPAYFASRAVDRLKLDDSGLRGVESVGFMTDAGTEDPITWLGATYSAVTYTLPVTITQSR